MNLSTKLINFVKMQAGGNDFIVFDNRKKILFHKFSQLARKLCKRKISIGADGLLILENSPQNSKCDFQMRYFNADGSEADFCANGASCLALFSYKEKIVSRKMNFLAKKGIIFAEIKGEKVKLKLPSPRGLCLDFPLKVNGKKYVFSFLNSGVPHAINFVQEINKIDVNNLGKKIRYHTFFQPAGTNVDFVKIKNRNTISIRTYERGVEEETLSCGTGAVASAIIAGLKNLVSPPVKVLTRSGEILKVYYECNGKQAEEVYLENSPKIVFEGKIEI